MSRLMLVLLATTVISACSIQHRKPTSLDHEKLESSSVIFGSITFPNELNRFTLYTVEVRSLDTGEVHSFTLNEYVPDLETPKIVRGLFLRQVPPGRYELVGIRTSNHPYSHTLTNKNPPKVNIQAGQSVYLGSHFVRFEWDKNLLGMPVPAGPSLLILDDLEIDHGLARKLFPSMPGLQATTSAPWLTEEGEDVANTEELETKTAPVFIPVQ